jgi:hypothetical protein
MFILVKFLKAKYQETLQHSVIVQLMKERVEIITLAKSEYREIPAPEATRKPEADPFRKKQKEWIKNISLNYTRRQLADIPILALVLPIKEISGKPHNFTRRNGFLELIDLILYLFAHAGKALSSKDKEANTKE